MSSDLPTSPEDAEARRDAARTIAKRLLVVGVPVLAIAVLCLLLGVPWWLVGGGIALAVLAILFET